MAQVRRLIHNPSSPPRQFSFLPDPLRLQPPISRTFERAQSLQALDRPPYNGSSIRNLNPTVPPPPVTQTGLSYNITNRNYDPLTGLLMSTSNTTATTANNLYNDNFPPSYIPNLSNNYQTTRERTLPPRVLPPPPPSSSENLYFYRLQEHDRLGLNNNETEHSVAIPTTLDDDDGLPVVSLEKTHLPVYARFPFDVSFIPEPMDTNVEDNVHKLRLRLIDSELNHQRRSTDDYIKRTQGQLSLLSPKPNEHYISNVRPPTNLTYRRITPKLLSRETSYSPLASPTPMLIDRIAFDTDRQSTYDIERDLEIRRIQESLNTGRQSNQQLMISNYSYDPRIHLQPVNERQYSSSNMDDLIDSMARRHLAYRRLDVAIDRQRRSTGSFGPYVGLQEPLNRGRRTSLHSLQRTDDIFIGNTTNSSLVESDYLRTRGDYYIRNQHDPNSLVNNSMVRTSSYSRLPPISPATDTTRMTQMQNPSHSALYQTTYPPQGQQNYQPSVPLTLVERSEHMIELPSDIYLTSRTEQRGSSQRHTHMHKPKSRLISRNEVDVTADLESDQSDGDNHTTIRQPIRRKPIQEKLPQNDHHGFFTEETSQKQQQQQRQQPDHHHHHSQQQQQPQQRKIKSHRTLFKKAAIGICFLIVLKHRAAKSRLTRPRQTLSATIHKIRLQEIMVALHRVYLEPDGPIYNALIQAVTSSIELTEALNRSSKFYADAISVIGEALKNIVIRIVDFMPRDGVLGTAKNSAVAALLQDGNPFPDNYFWKFENELLAFNRSKVIDITKQRAILLLIGVFIFRALVTTLLIKPIKYRLLLGELTNIQKANLKILASVMFYVGRRAVKPAPQILPLPHEWKYSLYSDEDIEPIIQNSEIKSILTTCEHSLRGWCEEYIRRIDASFGNELRT